MSEKNDVKMPLGRKNYFVIAVAVLLLVIGFFLLAGGGSDDPEVFNYEMFSARRIVVAPVVLVAGFVLVGFGIMKQFKDR